jgi:WD40 repeat protein
VPGRLRQETDGPADFHPSFSPDGGTIVFSRRQGRSVDVYRKELGEDPPRRDCLYGGPGADEAYVDAGLDNVNCSPAPDVIETIY